MLKNFNPLTWLLGGLLLCIGFLFLGFMMFWRPNMTEVANFKEATEAYQAESAKSGQATRRVKETAAAVRAVDQEWAEVVQTKTPPASVTAGGIDLSRNRYQLTVDVRRYRNSLQNAVNAQLKTGGIKVIQGPEIPLFSQNASDIIETGFNYPAVKYPVVVYDLGTVTVEGTYSQIVANVEGWSNMPNYMAVADGLAITGTSPTLRATYNLSIIGFIRGSKIAGPVPEGGATAQAPAFGGAAPGAAPGGPAAGGGGRGRPQAASAVAGGGAGAGGRVLD